MKLIKDSENLLPFNTWTCGDYTNDLTNFTINNLPNTTLSLSKDYSTNGEYGLKIHRSATETPYTQLKTTYTIHSDDYGKTATITMDVKNQLDGNCSLLLNMGSNKYVNIPPGTNNYTISSEIPSGISSFDLGLTFAGARTGTLYADNWILTIK